MAPAEPGRTFTDPRRVGWMLKRHRFRKGPRGNRAKVWEVTREEIESCACAYGVRPQENCGADAADATSAAVF